MTPEHDNTGGVDAKVKAAAAARKRRMGFAIVAGVAGFLVIMGLVQRHSAYVQLAQETAHDAVPVVQVIYPQHAPDERELSLPANIAAWYQAPIYAQVSGYVKMWYKDFGARVKAGDVLAEIDTPGWTPSTPLPRPTTTWHWPATSWPRLPHDAGRRCRARSCLPAGGGRAGCQCRGPEGAGRSRPA